MRTNEPIRIAIAETSAIVRGGVSAVLKRLPNLRIQTVEISSELALRDFLSAKSPDVLIVNPSFGGYFQVDKFKEEWEGKCVRVMALLTSFVDPSLLEKYDASLSIFDSLEVISQKIQTLLQTECAAEEMEASEALSQREKEIVVCVVKGMTNKEIAEQLFLSIHTVITHRKNITRKLQIHSVSGLTIYAIVNKLVSLGELKNL